MQILTEELDLTANRLDMSVPCNAPINFVALTDFALGFIVMPAANLEVSVIVAVADVFLASIGNSVLLVSTVCVTFTSLLLSAGVLNEIV